MRNIIKLVILISFFGIYSCYEDKGNYDYTKIERVVFGSIEKSYDKICMIDTYDIKPEIANAENYTYIWTVYSQKSLGANATIDTISREKDLLSEVTLTSGDYFIRLEAKNKKTGSREYFTSSLYVSTAYTNNWYVLKEDDNGNTEVDILTYDLKLSENILEKVVGRELRNTPTDISLLNTYTFPDASGMINRKKPVLVVSSIDDTFLFKLEDMSLIYDRNSMFFSGDPQESILHCQYGYLGVNYKITTTGGIYYQFTSIITNTSKFGLPIKKERPYRLTKYSYFTSYSAMYFDELNRSFVAINNSGSFNYFNNNDKDNNSMAVKPNNLNCNLLYMGVDFSSDRGYALMSNVNKSERYIFKLDPSSLSNMYNPISKDVDTLRSNLKIYDAKIISHNAKLPYLYYSNGSGLNMYDCSTKTEWSDIATYPGEKITMINHFYWKKSNIPEEDKFEYLIVATEKDGKYKIYFHTLLAGRPDPDKQPQIAEGNGIVAEIQFTSSKMSAFDIIKDYPRY